MKGNCHRGFLIGVLFNIFSPRGILPDPLISTNIPLGIQWPKRFEIYRKPALKNGKVLPITQ